MLRELLGKLALTRSMPHGKTVHLSAFITSEKSEPVVNCYRVCEKYRKPPSQVVVVAESLVWEDTRRQKFMVTGGRYYPEPDDRHAVKEEEQESLENLFNTLLGYYDVLLPDSDLWKEGCAGTIDGAVEVSKAPPPDHLFRAYEDNFEPGGARGVKARASLTYEPTTAEGKALQREIKNLVGELRRKAGERKVYWESVGQTPAGRECQVLRIEG